MQQDCLFNSNQSNKDTRQKTPSESANMWWCHLIRDRRWSTAQKRQLIGYFKCPELVLAAPDAQIRTIISGRQRNSTSKVQKFMLDADLHWLTQDSHYLVPITDQRYPAILRQLLDAPLALFGIGDIALLNEPQVAIVGSRKPTPIGDKITRSISRDLASLGVVVTSGMALGIDGIAHQAALGAGGSSIAVLGNGLDTIYPSRHKVLFEQLSVHGLLVFEYPLGVKPARHTFPQRNRIVSGLSHGVVIVEAAERSGTLITARLAMEQNRDVMVVPGSALSSQYRGSHQLIKQGAALVSSSDDVLYCLSEPLSRFLQSADGGSPIKSLEGLAAENPLLQYISAESTSVNDIILGSQLTSAEVSSMLLELELIGAVAMANDGGYVNLS
ncbi:MAG: DNA-protecting protein DprA [Arenicella sp.]|nr:DNA-protecting protein DprA [Arenicella sp.]